MNALIVWGCLFIAVSVLAGWLSGWNAGYRQAVEAKRELENLKVLAILHGVGKGPNYD